MGLVRVFIIFIFSVGLQIFLSFRKKHFIGLILPILNFIGSLLMQMVIYINQVPEVPNPPYYEIQIFAGQNLLTVVLLVIYGGIRIFQKRQEELRAMKIQDIG